MADYQYGLSRKIGKEDKLYQKAYEQSNNKDYVPEKPGYYVVRNGGIYQLKDDGGVYLCQEDSEGAYWVKNWGIKDYWNDSTDIDIIDLSEELVDELGLKTITRYYEVNHIDSNVDMADDAFGKLLRRLTDVTKRKRLIELWDEAVEEFKYFAANAEHDDEGYDLRELTLDTEMRRIYAARELGEAKTRRWYDKADNSKRMCVFLYPVRLKRSAAFLMWLQYWLEAGHDVDAFFVEPTNTNRFIPAKDEFEEIKNKADILQELYPETTINMYVIRWDGGCDMKLGQGAYGRISYFIDVVTGERWGWSSEWNDYHGDSTDYSYPHKIKDRREINE